MNIGLVDVDGHGFPNLALMKISAYHKTKGDTVEWANMGNYDRTYISKIFTFSKDFEFGFANYGEVIKGGTGYDIKSALPIEMELCDPDYSIYNYPFSIQFFSRGCIRKCGFCLVNEKEGKIRSVEPMALNPNGKWIEVFDNNFFANSNWMEAVEWLNKTKQPVNLHGVDIRIMNEEQAFYLNTLRLKRSIHIAWDIPSLDLTEKLKEVVKYIKPHKITCYVLIGFGSTKEQDLFRINTLKELGISPYVMPYRSFDNSIKPDQYQKDLARWVNCKSAFKSTSFDNYMPRKGFKCSEYL